MELQSLSRVAGLVLAAALVIPIQGAAPDEEKDHPHRVPHYRVVDLGTLGGDYSFAWGISSKGAIAASAATVGRNR